MTDVVLVRHGETVWHAEHRYAGSSDVALTPLGIRQAELLARWAEGAGLSAVWSSQLQRARLTATVCADAVGVPLRVDERLREVDFGSAEGLTHAEIAERFPAEFAAFEADPVRHHLPGGEDPASATARFTESLWDIAGQEDGRVLVVAHGTAMRLALCQLLGVPLGDYRRLFPAVRNTAVTELRLAEGRAAVLEFNGPVERVPGR